VVGSIANFKAAKDHATMLEAAARVRAALPSVRFLLVGQGPLEPQVRRLATELGLDGTVIFAGFRTDAQRLVAGLDVFALSSTYEGLPIALIEAMSLGRPAVVTRVGGVPEVVTDGAQALLVPPRDPAALADGLLRLLGDPELRARMGTAARARSLDFDIRKAVRRMEQVYAELLA
jgi:glycosyltransferase involved in cell wall biosynthesis